MLRQQLYCLVRLLLASSDEVPAAQQAALAARLDTLWDCLHHAMQQYYRVPLSRAQDLTSQVVHALLREECCRQSIHATISLPEALSLAGPLSAATTGPNTLPEIHRNRPLQRRDGDAS